MGLVDDLWAILKPGGFFTPNPEPNQGWINLGPQKKGDGPSWTVNVKNDRIMIVQDIEPYDSEITELTQPFGITPIDTGTPWVQRLHNNNPFSDQDGNSLIEDVGKSNAVYARTSSSNNPVRQFLFFRVRYWNGMPIYSCDVIPAAKWDDLGNSKMDQEETEAATLTYLPVRDQFCMAMIDGVYQPVTRYRIWGGKGYAALGGLATFAAAPTAVAGVPAGEATLSFAVPTGPADPWTYTVQQSTDGGTTAGSEITPDDVTVSSGTVTLDLSSLTSGASVLRAVARGTNDLPAFSPWSSSITVAS